MSSFNEFDSYNLSRQNLKTLQYPSSHANLKEKVQWMGVVLEEPIAKTLKLFRDKLIRSSQTVTFQVAWNYKPSYAAYEHYGDINLDYIIMFVNNIVCKREFNNTNIDTLLIPSMSAIDSMTSYQQKYGVSSTRVLTTDEEETTLYKF